MITAIRLQNFRSVLDSGWVKLAPITVVLGRNSAGKSSFLRAFPLLKQSLEADTKEPLLWFGRFVDFGGFSEVVSRFAATKELTLSFRSNSSPKAATSEVTLMEEGEAVFYYVDERKARVFLQNSVESTASLTLKKREKDEGTFVARITLQVMQDSIEIYGNEEGEVTGVKVGASDPIRIPKIKLRTVQNGFFPVLVSMDVEGSKAEMIQARREPFFSYVASRLDWLFHGNTKQQKRRQILRQLKWGAGRDFYDHLASQISGLDSRLSWRETTKSVPSEVIEVRQLVLLQLLPRILAHFNAQLVQAAGAVRYLAPVRASATRYYRFQELSVDQIDPQGENVPMFLNSLDEREREALETWMYEALGFAVRSIRSGGHAALMVSEGYDGQPLNLADTGFGYSQVLPIALQVWKSLRDQSTVRSHGEAVPYQLVIEQPELHLHPQFQAALADVFAAAAKPSTGASARALSFLIETHSEHIVNRLGELVELGALSQDDVQIVLFDKPAPTEPAAVRQSKFSQEGVLEGDWPYGFFVPQL